jgi:hypothetical protein
MIMIAPEQRGNMNTQKPVFVDRRGSRRRLVIAVGVAVGVGLAGWLTLIIASFAVAGSG